MSTQQLGELPFRTVAREWLEQRRNKISKVTYGHTEDYLGCLERFFGDMRLCDIHIGNVAQYQLERQEQIRKTKRHRWTKQGKPEENTDGASRINHELGTLGRILTRAHLWAAIKEHYEPLPLPYEGPGIALQPEEEHHLFDVARSNKRWFIAYCANMLNNATATGPGEIKHLRLRDIGLEQEFFDVHERVKNRFRVRRVYCNEDARWALRQLLDRAQAKGAVQPEHFLLPQRAKSAGGAPDPTKPMGSWKKAHWAIRQEAAKKFPRLATLRRVDFRHNATTKMLENPEISERTIEEFVGHRLNSKTKEKYSHIRVKARKQASLALSEGHGQRGEEAFKKPALAAREVAVGLRRNPVSNAL